MDMEKKKLDPLTKVKIMLAVEYAIFVVLFAVLGILFLTEIIKVQEWKRYAFTYVTLAGGLWLITDFFWTTFSPKRRAANCLLDKILMLPVGIALLCWDIYAIVNGCAETLPYALAIGINFCYIAAVYLFQTVYHWFHPIPAVIAAAMEGKEAPAEKEDVSAEISEENSDQQDK